LKIDPAKLERYSMQQAVEHVAKINEWREAQRAKAKVEASRNAATVPFKQYDAIPETNYPNERGLNWVQIKPTGKREELEKALKYEGDVMGHCVGGYCFDVESGRTQIYSLRDKKGEPHVTIEVMRSDPISYFKKDWDALPQIEKDAINRRAAELQEPGTQNSDFWSRMSKRQAFIEKFGSPPLSITQIKGKQNRKPNKEYIPFVQDFVRGGNWVDIGDLRNARMAKVEAGQRLPGVSEPLEPGYYTFKELEKMAEDKGVSAPMIEAFINRLRRGD
jgi:hypothetical protein